MKPILIPLLLLTLISTIGAQQAPGNKILDVNYTAIKNAFTWKISSRLQETDDWNLRGFRSRVAYSHPTGASRFSIGYDLWRGDTPNSPIGSSLVLSYSANIKFTSVNLSLTKLNDGLRPELWTGRIDVVTKW